MNRLQTHPRLKLVHMHQRAYTGNDRPRISRPDLPRELTGSGTYRKTYDDTPTGSSLQKNTTKRIKPLKF